MPMGKKRKKYAKKCARILALSVMVGTFLAGCSMKTDTAVSKHVVNLVPDIYRAELATGDVTDDVIYKISEHYRRFGDEGIDLTITYDPHSSSNTAMHAANEAARIGAELDRLGIRNLETGVMPVKDLGDKSTALLSYKTVTAKAPPECEAMGGMDGMPMAVNADYKFGCSTEMLLARQIARPKDLAGRTEMTEADSRRQMIILERYRAGQTNEAIIGGQSATAQ